jgi:predicted RNA-binding protein with PUA-like domain
MRKESACWLMKSEPDVYSFDDLVADGAQGTCWEGVRNYQARNFMQQMKRGDRVLFYHSNTAPPHVAGIAEVVREAYPDDAAWDPASPYYDPQSTAGSPRWFMVDVRAVEALPRPVTLDELKSSPALAEMRVVQKGQRLSVMPVSAGEMAEVLRMGGLGGLR